MRYLSFCSKLLYLSIISIIFVQMAIIGCVPTDDKSEKTIPADTSEPTTDRESQAIDEQPEPEVRIELPFVLMVGNEQVGSDLKVRIPEGFTPITLMSNITASGDMMVIDSAGMTMHLGTWQAEQAQFYHTFSYGENRLIVIFDNTTYEIMVICGVSEPGTPSSDCSGAFMNPTESTRWEYAELTDDEVTASWTYSINNLRTDEQGNLSYSLIMSRVTGVEQRIDRMAELHLYCKDNVIYITRAVERQDMYEWISEYESNSVYLPSEFIPGTTFERKGSLTMLTPEGTLTYALVERLSCDGSEEISVGAGDFSTFRVEFEIERTSPDDRIFHSGISWYAPGVGRILSAGDMEGHPVLELVSYQL